MNVIYPFLLYLLLYEPLASVLYRIFHDALGLDLTRLFCLLCSGLFVLVLELDLLRRGPGTYSDFHKIELKNGKALHFPGSILLAVVAGSLLNRGITYLSTRIVSKGFADGCNASGLWIACALSCYGNCTASPGGSRFPRYPSGQAG